MIRPGFEPDATLARVYPEAVVGGFSRIDGAIEFYTRINALVDAKSRVLEVGAARTWTEEPVAEMSRTLRMLRGRVAEVVGADVDPVVRSNMAVDRAVVLRQAAPLPFEDASFDLVIADGVLERIDADDADRVADEFVRVLKPGGWLAARTPNKWGPTGLGARILHGLHTRLLAFLQPDRPVEDVSPLHFAMNSRAALRRLFSSQRVIAYGHTGEPAAGGRSAVVWRIADVLGRLTPRRFAPTLMIFVQKS